MARADLLVSLVQAARQGDQVLLERTVEALIAEERANQHNVLADRLEQHLRANGKSAESLTLPSTPDAANEVGVLSTSPQRTMDDLILPPIVKRACEELVEEQHRAELLRSFNLEPRNRVLLVGPPGNGKTTLAEAIAERLMVSFLTLRYEGLIGSYLGETATRLRRLFDYVRGRRCVLFVDEFDTLAKERGDIHETGEIKRVVSSLLLQIDALPSHVVIVTATNHPELLDRAVWRRFQLRLTLPSPGRRQRTEWFERFQARSEFRLAYSPATLANRLSGTSFAELEEFTTDLLRRWILERPSRSPKQIADTCLAEWRERFATSASQSLN
jgi:Predicted ATPase (AAA+ superfamily)